MQHYLAKIGSALLLIGVLVGAMWFDRANITTPVVNAVVERVIDGDTIDVRIDQQPVRFRLVGIDAPELSQKNGSQAQQFLVKLVQGESVRIAVQGQDKYGRSLGTVFVKSAPLTIDAVSAISINALMVGSGMAWAYRYQGEIQDPDLGDLEAQARAEKRGLWVNAAAVEPWQWRKAQQN